MNENGTNPCFVLCVSMVFECGKNRGMVESEKKRKKK